MSITNLNDAEQSLPDFEPIPWNVERWVEEDDLGDLIAEHHAQTLADDEMWEDWYLVPATPEQVTEALLEWWPTHAVDALANLSNELDVFVCAQCGATEACWRSRIQVGWFTDRERLRSWWQVLTPADMTPMSPDAIVNCASCAVMREH